MSTTTSSGEPTTPDVRPADDLLKELQEAYRQYRQYVDGRKRGQTLVLVELVVFRGMGQPEAANLLGVSHQAISLRLRKYLAAQGIEHPETLSFAQFVRSGLWRPFEGYADEDLLALLVNDEELNRELGKRCRDLLDEMRPLYRWLTNRYTTYGAGRIPLEPHQAGVYVSVLAGVMSPTEMARWCQLTTGEVRRIVEELQAKQLVSLDAKGAVHA